MNDKAVKQIKIGADTKTKLDDVQKKLGITFSETIDKLIEVWQDLEAKQTELMDLEKRLEDVKNQPIEGELSLTMFNLIPRHNQDGSLKTNPVADVKRALELSNLTSKELATEGLIQKSKYYVSTLGKIDLESMSDDELRAMTIKGSAYQRITQTIDLIKNFNDSQGEKKFKIFLSPSMIFRLTGCNRGIINNYFEKYKLMIADHNNKHELTELDNRKGKFFDFKKTLGLD